MNISLSLPSNVFQFSVPRRNHSISTHGKKLTLNPTKSLELISPKCSQTLLPARVRRFGICSKLGTYIPHESRTLQFRANNGQGGDTTDLAPEGKLNWGDLFVKFVRPYSMIGSFLLYSGHVGRIYMESPHLFKLSLLPKAVAILVAILCTSAYGAGFNQLCDVEIDKINKPELVLASGDLPLGPAWVLVTGYIVMGILASAFVGSKILMASICTKFISVYIYNAPPIRLKRTTAGAVFSAAVWTLMNNLAAFGGTRYILGLPFQISVPVLFFMTFSSLFHATLCILKDLSDVEGDRKYGIKTLAVMFGVRNTALLGSSILMVNYVYAIMQAIYNPQAFRAVVMIPAFTAMATILAFRVWKLEKANYEKEACRAFFMTLWKLLYAGLVVFPFI